MQTTEIRQNEWRAWRRDTPVNKVGFSLVVA